MVKRGEVWLVALDPTIGSEIQKTRPCLIISPPELHDHLRTVIGGADDGKPGRLPVPVSFQGKTGLVLLDQIRTLDKQRLVKRLGAMSPPSPRP